MNVLRVAARHRAFTRAASARRVDAAAVNEKRARAEQLLKELYALRARLQDPSVMKNPAAVRELRKEVKLLQTEGAKLPALGKKPRGKRVKPTMKLTEKNEVIISKAAEQMLAEKSVGGVRPYNLYVQVMSARKMNFKAIAESWRALPEKKRQEYAEAAYANLQRRREIRAEFKRPMTGYQAFVKEHFGACYEAAQRETPNRQKAFKAASKTVAKLYRQHKKASAQEKKAGAPRTKAV